MKTLETERLIIEPIALKHCTETYLGWLNDPEVYKWLETRGSQTMPLLENFVKQHLKKGTYMWAIRTKGNGKHIGNIKMDPINQVHSLGEFGILMGDKSEWGKGYGKEASKKIMDFFFEKEEPLRKITLGVVEQNSAAIKLYEKLGFVVEGIYKDHVNYDGKYYSVLRMAKFNPKYAS